MTRDLSPRLLDIVDALPLEPGQRILEIGCGPGAMAHEIAHRIGDGHVLAIDRSETAIRQAVARSSAEIASGRLAFRCIVAEDFVLEPGEMPFDLAVAIRVGALDGRHPEAGRRARARIAKALVAGGQLFIDGGKPLKTVALDDA
ncbi:class I SAM-dependent methyltransferase [Sinorhizobium sp. RAC02]|uniref:SAM-dependent methyltransferase n=1 Tax=Sinorhizobium sp. RAC02 TaxID=1842534 RepID=UPI00083D032B|nr:class I SAM-dependent methyltransferase [Sinorhizobium sp. RAC02]AOF89956.1 methyltransferase small domain protein [Sinorhizobium sp. RAC02]